MELYTTVIELTRLKNSTIKLHFRHTKKGKYRFGTNIVEGLTAIFLT